MTVPKDALVERVWSARARCAALRARTDHPLPKGTPDRYHELVSPDGAMHARTPKLKGRAIPAQTQMLLVAARKSMYRAERALAHDQSARQQAHAVSFKFESSSLYPYRQES